MRTTGNMVSDASSPLVISPLPLRQMAARRRSAARLDASHASLAPLGLSAETLKAWKAGYSNSGTNRGRLAIALPDRDGHILGFVGRALAEEQPAARGEWL